MVSGGSALAADKRVTAGTTAAGVLSPYNWTGFYLGGNVGYGFGQSRTDVFFSDAGTGTPPLATGSSSKFNGVLGGAQTGYNWQAGYWLLGLEVDIQHTNQRATRSYACPGTLCNSGIAGFDAPASLVHTQELDWFGTLRARVGVTATPDALLYATGGLALAGISHVGTISGASLTPVLDENGAPALDANTNPITTRGSNTAGLFDQTTKLGWAAGVGVETHLIGNLSGKIEYLHMNFAADSVSAGNPNNATPLAVGLHSRITDDIVRVGLNYRLEESGQNEADDKPGMSKSRRRTKAPLPVPAWNWTGLYFGGHVGYSRGQADVTLNDPSADPSLDNFRSRFGTLTGGLQVGYNYLLPSRFLLGIEADASFPNYLAADDVAWSRTRVDVDRAQKIDYMATVRGRFGYAFPQWMIYATGGVAWSLGRFLESPGATDDVDKVLHLYKGWTAGIGAEVPIERGWTAKLEYLYTTFGHQEVMFQSGVAAGSWFDVHTVRAGLNYNFVAAAAGSSGATAAGSSPNSVRELGDPRADDVYPAGVSAVPFAVSRPQQLNPLGANPEHLDDQRISRPEALGRRGTLLQSRAVSGISACTTPPVLPASPTAKRRSRNSRIPITAPPGCSCGRRSGSGESRRRSRAVMVKWRERETSRG